METGLILPVHYGNRELRIYNQRNSEWRYPYPYETSPEDTLYSAGCGLFSLNHLLQWMHGIDVNVEELSDFACTKGGRGDDGTDRPALLTALMRHRKGEEWGFEYEGDGLRNGESDLWHHIYEKKGTALANLRKGHIVALVEGRIQHGTRQLLVIDSNSESAHEKVKDCVYEVLPDSCIHWNNRNKINMVVGEQKAYAMFWVDAALPTDYNLIHTIQK